MPINNILQHLSLVGCAEINFSCVSQDPRVVSYIVRSTSLLYYANIQECLASSHLHITPTESVFLLSDTAVSCLHPSLFHFLAHCESTLHNGPLNVPVTPANLTNLSNLPCSASASEDTASTELGRSNPSLLAQTRAVTRHITILRRYYCHTPRHMIKG